MPPIISVENLSKSYLVGHQSGTSERYTALRDVLGRSAKNFVRKGMDMVRGRQIVQGDEVEEFWALKDISFEVEQGDVLGIIGRNGAGKSSLLKVLSRITEPTKGRVSLRGRVASLLEVGTGFHPELTGRENIFLNGAILGMTRAEIKQKFDEIVAFAEVEKFLDTPVKRYSSGMYVRLAFAVAAHLDPEILVVDEVLAVGDVKFQQKCLGKMREIAGVGRTLLFVSHNLGSVRQLCQKCVLLESGNVKMKGPSAEVIKRYLEESESLSCRSSYEFKPVSEKPFQLLSSFPGDRDANFREQFSCDEDVFVHLSFQVRKIVAGVYAYCEIICLDGTRIAELDSLDSGNNPFDNLKIGIHKISLRIPRRVLGHGEYRIEMAFCSRIDDARDDPGLVAIVRLDDESTWRGNRRAGYVSMITHWAIAEPAFISHESREF